MVRVNLIQYVAVILEARKGSISQTKPVSSTRAVQSTPAEAVVSCAAIACTIEPSVQIVPTTSTYGVRCCSETEIPGFVFTGGSCNLWSTSENSVTGLCMTSETYQTAFDACDAYGARLCTSDENASNCSKASRCGLNTQLVWSSDIVPTNSPTLSPTTLPTVTASTLPSATASALPTVTTSALPSAEASALPSVAASAVPTIAVTAPPSVLVTSAVAAIACASIQCTIVPNPQTALTKDLYGARCCSDVEIPDLCTLEVLVIFGHMPRSPTEFV